MDFCEKGNVTELKAFLNERGVVEAAEAYRLMDDMHNEAAIKLYQQLINDYEKSIAENRLRFL